MKCEVLGNCSLVVEKGSIVEVSPRQFELAKKFLKPIETKKVEAKEEKVEVKPIEEAVQPKAKKVKK